MSSAFTRTVNITGIGGGTGLPVLLAGLHRIASQEPVAAAPELSISAIVATSDDGGSSGRLRSELKLPAIGDLRNCVTAMADHEPLRQLFQHRFLSDDGLHGHSLGNLVLAAMCQRSGSLARALDEARGLLGARGAILPVTEEQVSVCARLADGRVARGELAVSSAHQKISRVWLEPLRQPPAPGVLESIAAADVVVIGPGSLYTSIVPNLVVSGVADAIRETMALRVFVCNLMTQPGETDGFTATDHIAAIEEYLGERVLDVCVLNPARPRPEVGARYKGTGSTPVVWDRAEIAARGIVPVIAEVAAGNVDVVRHDSLKLARLIVSLATRSAPPEALEPAPRQTIN